MPGNTLGEILIWLESLDLHRWSFLLFNIGLFVIFVSSLIRFVISLIRGDRR